MKSVAVLWYYLITKLTVNATQVYKDHGVYCHVNKKVYTLPDVVLDGAYLLFVSDDVLFCTLVIRMFDVVVVWDIVLGVSTTLISNVQFPV